jgi:hypothetical protein
MTVSWFRCPCTELEPIGTWKYVGTMCCNGPSAKKLASYLKEDLTVKRRLDYVVAKVLRSVAVFVGRWVRITEICLERVYWSLLICPLNIFVCNNICSLLTSAGNIGCSLSTLKKLTRILFRWITISQNIGNLRLSEISITRLLSNQLSASELTKFNSFPNKN